jgi:Flp pilus assembly pilin Flp
MFNNCVARVITELRTSDLANDEGQTLVEYALIIALVAIVCVGAIGFLTGGIENEFTTIKDSL